MAVVQTGGRTDAGQEFTNNKRLLLASVDKFMGRKLQSITGGENPGILPPGRHAGGRRPPLGIRRKTERAYNAAADAEAAEGCAEWFRQRARQTEELRSSAKASTTTSRTSSAGLMRQGTPPPSSRRHPRDRLPRLPVIQSEHLTDRSARSHAARRRDDRRFWLPGPGPGIGLSSLRNELQMSQDSLRALSDETGGFCAAVNTNQFSTAFERIVGDNSTYYVLAYYPPTDKKDGKFHRIDVKVTRRA